MSEPFPNHRTSEQEAQEERENFSSHRHAGLIYDFEILASSIGAWGDAQETESHHSRQYTMDRQWLKVSIALIVNEPARRVWELRHPDLEPFGTIRLRRMTPRESTLLIEKRPFLSKEEQARLIPEGSLQWFFAQHHITDEKEQSDHLYQEAYRRYNQIFTKTVYCMLQWLYDDLPHVQPSLKPQGEPPEKSQWERWPATDPERKEVLIWYAANRPDLDDAAIAKELKIGRGTLSNARSRLGLQKLKLKKDFHTDPQKRADFYTKP